LNADARFDGPALVAGKQGPTHDRIRGDIQHWRNDAGNDGSLGRRRKFAATRFQKNRRYLTPAAVQPSRFLHRPPRHSLRREFLDEVDRSIRIVSEQRTLRSVSFHCSISEIGLAASWRFSRAAAFFSPLTWRYPKTGVICRTRQAAR
jgi:hypothetical protein